MTGSPRREVGGEIPGSTPTFVGGSPLGPEAVRAFRRQGWLKLDELLSGTQVAALRAAVDAAEEDPTLDPAAGDVGHQTYYQDPRWKEMFDNRTNLRFRHHDLLPVASRIARVIAPLFDGDEVRIWWDKTFTKPPARAGTRATVWHQDTPNVPVDRRGALTVWVAVEDVPLSAGPLKFLAGSHRLGPLGRTDLVGESRSSVQEFLNAEDLELVGEVETAALAAGDATVHDGYTLHAADENTSSAPRRGWTLLMFPASSRYTGAPHVNVEGTGLQPYATFDHPRFLVGS